MEKRRYVPMKMEVEEFQMNEAVAACENKLLYAGAKCDTCNNGHTWDIYDEDGQVSVTETFIAVSSGDTSSLQGMCSVNQGATTGNRALGAYGQVWEGSATGRAESSGLITHLKPNIGTDTWKDYIPNYVSGSGTSSVATVALIQNS